MQANIVDLRYHMKEVVKAIHRNEEITVLYRGEKLAIIKPIKKRRAAKVNNHPFFGMYGEDQESVAQVMKKLRGGRYRDI